MKELFKIKLRKTISWLIVLFVVLFLFRLAYGYTKKIDLTSNSSVSFENIVGSRRNYATKKYKASNTSVNQSAVKVDQKYEKIADIKTKSTEFEKDEVSTRNEIKKFNALIQFEQKSGNKGRRKLNLIIGVPPENFDKIYNELIKIGNIQAKQITKKDKTNEYKELNAKKKSLEKIRTSLIALKEKGGKIDEYMGLENRILEIEQQLQGLGVSLGDFDEENEFCTVKFSIVEVKKRTISTMHRIKVALEWTVKIYLRIMVILFFVSLFSYILLLIIDKLKIFEKLVNRK